MKISPEQIEALRQQSQIQKPKSTGAQDSFGDLLAQEVDKNSCAATPQASAPPLPGLRGLNPLLQVAAPEAVAPDKADTERTRMQNVEGLLEDWEKYAEQLRSPGAPAHLRQAYGQLERIESGVRQLKEKWPAGEDGELRAVVDEIEIMSVTEKFKFNRGDYL